MYTFYLLNFKELYKETKIKVMVSKTIQAVALKISWIFPFLMISYAPEIFSPAYDTPFGISSIRVKNVA